MSRRAIVLLGHGSRRASGNAGVFALGERLRAASGLPVSVGFIELAEPSGMEAVDRVVAGGAEEIVVSPAVLLAAGHAKNDVPYLVQQARARYPDRRFYAARPMGLHPELLAALGRRFAEARAALPEVAMERTGLILLGRGSSDPDANADVYKLARLLCERRGLLGFEVGFIGVTQPTLQGAFEALARRRPRQVIILPYLLYPGVLASRVREQGAALGALHRRIAVGVSPEIGSSEAVPRVMLERVREAVEGGGEASCDTCKYRAPMPGFTDELGGAQAWRKARAHATRPIEAPPHAHAPPRKHVLVCVNRDCADKGGVETLGLLRQGLRERGLSRVVRTTRVMCLGRCGEGPSVVVYPDGVWYRQVTPAEAPEVLESHLVGDHPVGRLIDQVIG